MLATVCLLTSALLPAQPADRADGVLVPRLSRGQELVYRGSFTEEALGQGIQFQRSYRLECRVFVLDTPARGLDVAFCTVLKQAAPSGRGAGDPSSVRLETVRITLQGRVEADGSTALLVPLEGPATLECGAFVEAPRGRIAQGQTWEVAEAGRPALTWRIAGTEMLNGTSCVKLVGRQQSDDWDQPRADRTAWRRSETVWVAVRLGAAYRVERTIERRAPARREPTQRAVVRYELESSIQYPNQLFEDRRREIAQARSFADAAAPMLPNPAKHPQRTFDTLLAKMQYHLDHQPPTPYREAVLQVKRRVEAARRGEAVPTAAASSAPAAPTLATIGHKAPDFVATNLTTRESVRLHHLFGKPILLVFFSPTSQTAEDLLRFGRTLQDAHRQSATVLGLALSDDAERVQQLHTGLRLTYAVLSGGGMRRTYGVDATPRLVVLDAAGVVQANFVGWGPETPGAVADELKRWLGKGVPGSLLSRPPTKP